MKLDSLGEIIATRSFHLADERVREVVVSIGKPQPFPDSEDYYCPYQVKELGRDGIKYVGGVDAFQALQEVMKVIGAELDALNQEHAGKLRWDDAEEGYLGFPASIPDK
jgi:hypothetical protein